MVTVTKYQLLRKVEIVKAQKKKFNNGNQSEEFVLLPAKIKKQKGCGVLGLAGTVQYSNVIL